MSSGYVLTLGDGRRILIDADGGRFERLGRAGVGAAELDLVLLTHLHIDHSGGLAPIAFSAFMEGRTDSLTVVGPTAETGRASRFCEALSVRTARGATCTPLRGSASARWRRPARLMRLRPRW